MEEHPGGLRRRSVWLHLYGMYNTHRQPCRIIYHDILRAHCMYHIRRVCVATSTDGRTTMLGISYSFYLVFPSQKYCVDGTSCRFEPQLAEGYLLLARKA